VSSNVTLPIGGGRIAYVVAPSTARWFRRRVVALKILYHFMDRNLTVGGIMLLTIYLLNDSINIVEALKTCKHAQSTENT
jgi:hypothetical protein